MEREEYRSSGLVRFIRITKHFCEEKECRKRNEITELFSSDLLHASPSVAMLESDDNESISIRKSDEKSAKCAFFRV